MSVCFFDPPAQIKATKNLTKATNTNTATKSKKKVTVQQPKQVDEQQEKTIQARFLQAIKELRWMGFVKPVGKRQDVVARTVFSFDTW